MQEKASQGQLEKLPIPSPDGGQEGDDHYYSNCGRALRRRSRGDSGVQAAGCESGKGGRSKRRRAEDDQSTSPAGSSEAVR